MKTGKITAKLRDAVPVCLMVEGKEVKRYKNIGLPDSIKEEAEASQKASTMEISYNVTGPRRKELATAVGDFIGTAPVYQKAPTYAFAIGSYIIDRNGKLSGERNEELTEALAA